MNIELENFLDALDIIEHLASKNRLASEYISEFKTIDDYKYKLARSLSKSVLTEEEKGWLLEVIEPYKNEVLAVSKVKYGTKYECLFISLMCEEEELDSEEYETACFKANSHYQGMELNKLYTLKELGL